MKDTQNLPLTPSAAEETARERNSFIGKVYLLLVASLLLAAGTAALGIHHNISPHWFGPAVMLEFITLFYAFKVRYEKGYNLFALFAFVISTGLIVAISLGAFINAGKGPLILPAFWMTIGLFTILSLYTFISGRNFSFLGGFLFVCLLVLLGGWVMMALAPAIAPFSKLAMASAGVLVFSGYVLFDTSQMIHVLSTDDYIEAVLGLYLDILNMFMDFLHILAETGGALWDSIGIADFFSIDL